MYGILHIPSNTLVTSYTDASHDEWEGTSVLHRLSLGDENSVPFLTTSQKEAERHTTEENWFYPWHKDYEVAQAKGELKVVEVTLTFK